MAMARTIGIASNAPSATRPFVLYWFRMRYRNTQDDSDALQHGGGEWCSGIRVSGLYPLRSARASHVGAPVRGNLSPFGCGEYTRSARSLHVVRIWGIEW